MPGPSSPQKVRTIQGPMPLTYSANSQVSQNIPGGCVIREMMLRLSFTMTSSANLAAAALLPGSEWGVVNLVQILAGTEVLREFTGEELRVMSMFWYKRYPRPRVALGATSTAVESTLMLPFWDTLSRRPMDTALNASNYGNLRIVVKWNDATKIASTGTVFTVAPQIDWTMETSTGGPDNMTFLETRMSRMEVIPPTGALTEYAIQLPVGVTAVRSLLVYCKDASGLDKPNKITTLRLKSMNTNLIEGTFAAFRDQALHRAGLCESVASSAKTSPMQETSFDLDNWMFLDTCKDGYLSEALNTFRIPDLRLLLTTTATIEKVVVLASLIIPPSK